MALDHTQSLHCMTKFTTDRVQGPLNVRPEDPDLVLPAPHWVHEGSYEYLCPSEWRKLALRALEKLGFTMDVTVEPEPRDDLPYTAATANDWARSQADLALGSDFNQVFLDATNRNTAPQADNPALEVTGVRELVARSPVQPRPEEVATVRLRALANAERERTYRTATFGPDGR